MPHQVIYEIPAGYVLDVTTSNIQFYNNIPNLGSSHNSLLLPGTYTVTPTLVIIDLDKYFDVNGGPIQSPDLNILAYSYIYFKFRNSF